MAGRNFLFVPGPTNVPDRVLRAMHRAMEDHRSSDFPALAAPVLETLKKIFKTSSGQSFIFPSSGTGAWEAARGDPDRARTVAAVLRTGKILVETDTFRRVDVSVILGEDFRPRLGIHP